MWLLLLSLILLQAPAPATPSHAVFESVISMKGGKEIGTIILLSFPSPAPGSAVTGWVQKHDFFPIDSGQVTETGFTFQAAGNTYQLNPRTRRLVYNGIDGSGDKLAKPLDAITGRVYKIREETDEGRDMTLQTDHGDQTMLVDSEAEPALWNRTGQPELLNE